MGIAGADKVDFMIKGIYRFQAFGQELWVSTTEMGLTIVTIVILIIAIVTKVKMRKATEVPGTFQNIIEFAVEALDRLASETMGHNAKKLVNYIGTIFIFILFCNIGGIFGLRTPTGDFGVTFMLGIFTFCLTQYYGIRTRGIRHLTVMFQPFPILFPINLIGEITNPLSQALRLFGNMLSGVVIMGLWYGMMPIFVKIGIPSFLHVYFDLFSGCIQTYVFCMLTMVYVNDKMD